MTETERYVNETCERIVASGHVWLYRDLYKDLRERMPCWAACRLIASGLRRTRSMPRAPLVSRSWPVVADRARAVAALTRLDRYAAVREFGELSGLYDGADRGL